MEVVLAHIRKWEARSVIVTPNTQVSWFSMIVETQVRSVQIVFKGEDGQFFRVHHQRGAEPYTSDRRGMRALKIDFSRNM